MALDHIRRILPFALKAIDSDNGSEFINYHLYRYCAEHSIQFTRGRPYKKDDNAHIEQKNWTHVRKLLGWERYDTPEALAAINALYRGPWRTMMNLFQPCVKLREKVRVGSRLIRRYDEAQAPLDRLVAHYGENASPKAVRALLEARKGIDPFILAGEVERQLGELLGVKPGKNNQRVIQLAQLTLSPRGEGDGALTPDPAAYVW